MSLSGFGSSFLPKEESVTAAPEVEVSKDYQASSQVNFIIFLIITDFSINMWGKVSCIVLIDIQNARWILP